MTKLPRPLPQTADPQVQKLLRRFRFSLDGNPIYFRTDTTDREVFNDIFVREEYGCAGEDIREPRLIVDCGAYTGYSTLFFLEKYKNAHVIAVEPDPENFELCRLNLEPYTNRVTLVEAAIWSDDSELALHRGELADGREWATMVQPAKNDESPDVKGIDLGTLLRDSGFTEIDLLKMNIECSEREVFSKNYSKWLPYVKNMIVQLHDEHAEEAFFKAMLDYGFLFRRPPTLVACTEISPRAPEPTPGGKLSAKDNQLSNGDFEEIRVAPAQIVPGAWIAGSSDIALDWRVIVSDPQFSVALAVRTGRQLSGENALLIRVIEDQAVLQGTAPYAAIENTTVLFPKPNERWMIRAAVKSSGATASLTRGAYLFLRLYYDDGSSTDLRTEPLMELTEDYVERGGVVQIPQAPPGRILERATLWLYVWIANPGLEAIPAAAFAPWEVLFDDVVCSKI